MQVLRTYGELDQHKAKFLSDDKIAFDIETTGLSPFRDKVALVQLYSPKHDLVAVVQTPGGVIQKAIRDIIENAEKLITHNGVAFDMLFLLQAGIDIFKTAEWFDTLVAESAVSSSSRHGISKSLGACLKRRLNISVDKDIDHTGWDGPLTDRQVEYAINDVIHLPSLMEAQIRLARETNQLPGLELEIGILPAVALMNFNGMPISRPHFDLYRSHLKDDLVEAEATLRTAFPEVENPNSTYQLQDGLANYGIETDSTAKDILQQWVYMGGKPGELAQIILDYRYIKQRLNMYTDKFYPKFCYRGRVKSHFWQVGAGTTRFTCSGPNLQQVPRDARWVFGNHPGMTFIKSDYAQIEVRVAAAIAEDQTMIGLLGTEDVHTAIASQVFEVAPEAITKDQRQKSKAMVFTLLFGGGPNALYTYARRMGADMTESDARLLISRFFRRFRGLHSMRQQATSIARNRRVATVRLPSGLKRVLAGRNLKPTTILNTNVQGAAAVGLKYGILEAHRRGLSKYLVAQIHDELDAFVPDAEAEDYQRELEESMLYGFEKLYPELPVKVESDVGPAWGPVPDWAEKRLVKINGRWKIVKV